MACAVRFMDPVVGIQDRPTLQLNCALEALFYVII